MRFTLTSLIAIFLFVSSASADTTWVADNIEGGVWNLEGSPYVLTLSYSPIL